MKNKILFIIILASSSIINAQTNAIEDISKKEIDLHYNLAHSGHNLSLNYNYYYGRHAGTIGLKKHLNQILIDDSRFAYKHNGYAQNFNEYIGINLGYKFDLLKNREIVTPYLFFQSQFSHLKMRLAGEYIDNSNNDPEIKKHVHVTNPYFIVENIIGIGMTTKIYKNLYLNQSVGCGISILRGSLNDLSPPTIDWDPASLLRLGITYRLN